MQGRGRVQRFGGGGFRHHYDELVATVTEAHVFGTGKLLDAGANAAEEFAANKVAVNVVD